MKELLGHASNIVLAPDTKNAPKVKAVLELAMICSEPVYSYGLDGLQSSREVSTTRMTVGHKALRETAQQLIALADEAEALEVAMNSVLGKN